jgi:uncharacterized glyoxalase superfamily protein PhnB
MANGTPDRDTLRALADEGNEAALDRLADLAERRGDLDELGELLDEGSMRAGQLLTRRAVEAGNLLELQRIADAGYDEAGRELELSLAPPRNAPHLRRNRSIPAATVIPVLIYPDVREAVAWLCGAFGFRERLRIGENHRSQLSAGAGGVIIGDVRGDRRPPRAGEVTSSVMVRVEDVRAHCERARAHGARILMEPIDFEYGERQYTAEDFAGHQWTFSQTLADVDPAAWGGQLVDEEMA